MGQRRHLAPGMARQLLRRLRPHRIMGELDTFLGERNEAGAHEVAAGRTVQNELGPGLLLVQTDRGDEGRCL